MRTRSGIRRSTAWLPDALQILTQLHNLNLELLRIALAKRSPAEAKNCNAV
ncbi:hypothetical protein J6590_090076 [Homalodisca vitripennis]|nr:hypothetical protein J6590_090076 [Homalodisca vitripennis]